MAFFDSSSSSFSLDDTGAAERALAAFIDDVNGLPGPRGLDEVTSLGDSGAKFVPGLENVQITISGPWEDTATTGLDAVMGPLRTGTATSTFKYGPKGTDSGFPRYTGECWVADYQVHSAVNGRVEWSATLQVDGQVTRDTF